MQRLDSPLHRNRPTASGSEWLDQSEHPAISSPAALRLECLGFDTPSHAGCLLAERLGIELRRVGNGKRMTFGAGEQKLSDWMEANAFVTWVEHPVPWEIEAMLIRELRPSLNLADNSDHPFCEQLAKIRKHATTRARSMEVIALENARSGISQRRKRHDYPRSERIRQNHDATHDRWSCEW